MSGIFISYRREDSAAYAGRLYDWISQHFGKDKIFIDVDTIQPGEDFVDAVEQKVGGCDALVALIGKDWLNCRDEEGNRRLDNQGDFVRVEIVAALNRNVRVIPVLVEGARMPSDKDLPEPLTKLTRRQALELSYTRFHQDANRLIEALEKALAAAEERRTAEQQRLALEKSVPMRPVREESESPKPATMPKELPAQTSQSAPGRRKIFIAIASLAAAAVIGGLALRQFPRPVERPTSRPAESASTSPVPPPKPAPQAPVIEAFTVDRKVLESGGSATLSWSVRGSGSVMLDPGIGPMPERGSRVVAPLAPTTYDLVARGPGGEARQSLTITVKPVPAPPDSGSPPTITEFAAEPNRVMHDGQATLRWKVQGATNVTLGPGTGQVGSAGTRVISPQASTTYELVARGPGGVTRRSVAITVESAPPPAPNPPTIELFTAQPNPVVRDQPVTLRWTVSGSASVTLGPGIGTVPETGTRVVTAQSSTTYELAAHGPGGVTTARVELKVTPPAALPISIDFSASNAIQRGEAGVLRWNVSNAESVSIDQGIGRVDPAGSRRVSPGETTVYKLTASGGGQEKEASVRIVVNAPPSLLSKSPGTTSGTTAGATSGTLLWKGDLQAFNVLIIDASSVTKGKLQGALPGLPVKVSVGPEMKVMEAPSQQNGWRRLVLQNNSHKRDEVKIAWQVIQP
jgi:TIR domain